MRKIVVFLFSVLLSNLTTASSCPGYVIEVLDWPSKCNSHIAYKLDTSNDKWICSNSDLSDSMILTAYAAKKIVAPRLNTSISPDCESLPSYYVPAYITVKD
jgi:hypothetical protein